MFSQKITLFNAKKNAITGFTDYNRTVLDAHWEATQGIKLGNINITTSTQFTVVVPLSATGFELPHDYANMVDVTGKWTLANGDYIVKGEVSAITKFSDLTNYPEKMVIDSYEINDQSTIEMLRNYTATGR